MAPGSPTDRLVRGRPHRFGTVLAVLGVLVLAVATLASPARVAAECPYIDSYPPFALYAPGARELFSGEIVAWPDPLDTQDWGEFAVEIKAVYRGDAKPGDIRQFRDLTSGVPGICAPSAFHPRMGDVIAFALDIRRSDGLRVNTLAYLRGDPDEAAGTTAITLAGLESVAALPQTATDDVPARTTAATETPATTAASGLTWLLPFGAALLAVIVVVAGPHRRTSEPTGPSLQGPD